MEYEKWITFGIIGLIIVGIILLSYYLFLAGNPNQESYQFFQKAINELKMSLQR